MNNLLEKIASENKLDITGATALAGGDINQVFWLKSKERDLVVKINKASKFPKMFEAEAKGLEILKATRSFVIPEVVSFGEIEDSSYLLMQYLSSRDKSPDFWHNFAQNLAKLHRHTAENHGLDHNNYIGSLPQINSFMTSASEFYIAQRLQPQFEMASSQGFSFKNLRRFYNNIINEIPDEAASLIHGDLWNGNYMTTNNGVPALIDPAICFAPREMDIAMMHLFGGFSEEVFDKYNSLFPMIPGWEQRLKLWQLYYLLVHLNIFGSSYLDSVKNIISKYI